MKVENNCLKGWMRWQIYVRKSSARKRRSVQVLLVTGKCSSFRGRGVYCEGPHGATVFQTTGSRCD